MLTKDDVTALRKADTVIFRAYQGTITVEAVRRAGITDEVTIYSAADQRLYPRAKYGDRDRVITVGGAVTGYADEGGWRDDSGVASGFYMIHSAQYDKTWPTLASLLRAGDRLALHFRADHRRSPLTQEAGVHVDDLLLTVKRNDRDLTFLLDVSVSYDNSARAVKRYA